MFTPTLPQKIPAIFVEIVLSLTTLMALINSTKNIVCKLQTHFFHLILIIAAKINFAIKAYKLKKKVKRN